MKLTKREVTLLFLLGVAALLYFGINYLILPQYNTNLDKQGTITSLNDQVTGLNLDTSTAGSINAQIDQAKAKSADLTKPFMSSFDREQVDYWLDTVIKQNGLAKYSIEFSDLTVTGTDFNAEKTLPDNQKVQVPLQNTVNTITGTPTASPSSSPNLTPSPLPSASPAATDAGSAPASGGSAQPAGPEMYSLQVVLNATGNYDNITRFLDALYASGRSLSVDGLTINDFEGGGKMAVVTMRFFGVPLLDQNGVSSYNFPTPVGQKSLMTDAPAPSASASASASPSASSSASPSASPSA